jgi:hypothetical protein
MEKATPAAMATPVTGPGAPTWFEPLAAGQNYWIGFITDTSFVYRPGRHGDPPAASSSGSDTYADGAADPFGTASAFDSNVPIYLIGSQAIPPAVGDSGKGAIVIAITC